MLSYNPFILAGPANKCTILAEILLKFFQDHMPKHPPILESSAPKL